MSWPISVGWKRRGFRCLAAWSVLAGTALSGAFVSDSSAQVVAYNYSAKVTILGDGQNSVQDTQGKWVFDAQSMRVLKIFVFPKSKTYRTEEASDDRHVIEGAKSVLCVSIAPDLLDFDSGLDYSSMVGDIGAVILGGSFGQAQWPKTLKGWVCSEDGKPARISEGPQSLSFDAKQTAYHNAKTNTIDQAAAEIAAGYQQSGYVLAP